MGATPDDVLVALGVFNIGLGLSLLVLLFLGQLITWLGVIREWGGFS